jgi:general secretion pathway protein I
MLQRAATANSTAHPARGSRGFTLVEVLVALAIAALSLSAVAAAVSQMVDAATSMKDRTFAAWIAQNKITELRLANVVPEVSETSGTIVYGGREWSWLAVVSDTGVENLFRVDVSVSEADSDDVIRTVTGFIGEPVIPGQSNIAWSVNSQAAGEAQ